MELLKAPERGMLYALYTKLYKLMTTKPGEA